MRLFGSRFLPLGASAGFQRWAFDTPFVRRIAKRRALALFDIVAGFVHAQTLAACVQLDLFRRLGERPRRLLEIAEMTAVPPERLERLLDAAAALDLLQLKRGRWRVGRLGAPLAGEGGAGVAAMVRHHGALYRDLADPLALLRDPAAPTALSRFWPYACESVQDAEPGAGEPYSRLMSASQDFIAGDVLDALSELKARRWLDLGGGDGAFLAEVAGRRPQLSGLVCDLPPVAALATARFAAAGLAPRLQARGCDIRRAAPASGFDVVSLVRILHDQDDPAALDILRTARAAVRPGATLVIAEPMRGGSSDPRIADAYFGLYLLAMGQGRMRTVEELSGLAAQAGWTDIREGATRRPFLVRLILASPAPASRPHDNPHVVMA